MFEYPEALKKLEFSLVRFQLEFLEPCRYDLAASLRLRRDLRAAAALVSETEVGLEAGFDLQALFDPPLPADPLALKRFQRPGPPFAFLPCPENHGDYQAGDGLELEFCFWGVGIQRLGIFAKVLQALGRGGLHRGQGPFDLTGIEAVDSAGSSCCLWMPGDDLEVLAPPIQDAFWWLETVGANQESVQLEFLTPARLLSHGRPLFRADFKGIFPFILRRVTSVAHAHCGIELAAEPKPLLEFGRRVEEVANQLRWADWRQLEGEGRTQDLGGVMGKIQVSGADLKEICWLLQLGTLMNLGKGAGYGAGRYRVIGAGSGIK